MWSEIVSLILANVCSFLNFVFAQIVVFMLLSPFLVPHNNNATAAARRQYAAFLDLCVFNAVQRSHKPAALVSCVTQRI